MIKEKVIKKSKHKINNQIIKKENNNNDNINDFDNKSI